MYDYILNMWLMNVITSDDVEHFAVDGWITIDEAMTIMNAAVIEGA